MTETKKESWNWKLMSDIPDEDDKTEFLKTGLKRLDEVCGGLILGGASIWTGTNGSAKSTTLGQIALNVVNSKQSKVGIFSGELPDKRFKKWLYLQASGKNHNQQKTEGGVATNFYETPLHIKQEITSWLGDRLYLYDNKKGFTIEQVGNSIAALVRKDKQVKLVIIDNLFVLDINKLSEQKWEAQRLLILKMCELAKNSNIHIAFVAHPTKVKSLIRKEDVSGSSDLTNAVDNVFILHRNTTDFKIRAKEFFGWKDDNPIFQYDNIIEIAKDRELGMIETLIGFYFQVESKRILNAKEENFIYGWDNKKQETFIPISEIECKEIDKIF
jgi:predicted ATP-dependent serine protease